MIRRNKNVNLADALDYSYIKWKWQWIWNWRCEFDGELEDTDFDNTKPKPINNITDEIKIANSCMDSDSSTESDGNTPENPVCNKKTRVYKWVNKPSESTVKKFDPPVPMPPPKEVNATPYKYFLEFVDAAMIENICTQTNLYYIPSRNWK